MAYCLGKCIVASVICNNLISPYPVTSNLLSLFQRTTPPPTHTHFPPALKPLPHNTT